MTDLCDLACRYCRPAGGAHLAPRPPNPSLEDLGTAASWLVRERGIGFVKVTGGEPLLRPGLAGFVERLASLPGVAEVSMTTNGTRLAAMATALASAGLRRVNVSLDTLDAARFFALTRGGDLKMVLTGIDAALAAGLAPVKLNAVLRRSTYREDVPAVLDLAVRAGLELRLIELMQTGSGAGYAAREFVSFREVASDLALDGGALPSPVASGPARRFRVPWRGKTVVLGAIQPVSHAFCGTCSRIRLDSRGRLLRCLMDPEPLPLLPRVLAEKGDLPGEVRAYLGAKRHPAGMRTPSPMAAIGG